MTTSPAASITPDGALACSANRYLALQHEAKALKTLLGAGHLSVFHQVSEDVFLAVAAFYRQELGRIDTPEEYQVWLEQLASDCADAIREDDRILGVFEEDEVDAALTFFARRLPSLLETWPGNPTRLVRVAG